MARIWLSELAQDIRGSIGNHTYSIWRGLNYIRNKAASIMNPCSADQENMRAKASATAKRWYQTLTDNQRGLWNEFAEAMTPKGGQGGGTKQVIPDDGGVMSGYNAYVRANCLAYSGDALGMGVFIDDAPIGYDAPDAPTNLACSWNGTTCEIDLTWVAPIYAAGGSGIRIWLVSLDAGVHKQLNMNVVNPTAAASIGAVKVALGDNQNIEDLPGHYHIQIDCVGPRGQKGPPSNICQVTVPTGCVPGP